MAKEGNSAGKGTRFFPGAISATLCGGLCRRNSKRLAHFKYQQLQTSLHTTSLENPAKKLNRLLAMIETKPVAKTETKNKGK